MTLTTDASAGSSMPAPNDRPAVLAVDDVEANLVALSAILEDTDCDLVLVKSGNDALRQLLRREFAVMLLDVQMPGMDGYEVAQHARRNPATSEVPIIFLTAANNSEGMVLRGYGSGAVDFLFKPLNPAILRSKVRVFLELHAARLRETNANLVLERTNTELRLLAQERFALADQFQRANVELKRAYDELSSTHAQLVQAAKMASLGELVAGVAHEINNPLAFVLSHLETIRRSLSRVEELTTTPLGEAAQQNWDRAGERLTEMTVGLQRIRELVLKLRTFSRLDEGERKRVSIKECVEAVLTILGHRIRDHFEVVTQFGEPDQVDCYASLLNQAIMNLVANAIDAMGETGKLRISTGGDGSRYTIIVADNGPGIPKELRDRVLEPFFTTKPVGQGTGLGLSITYSIVHKHGGTLVLRDASEGGAEAVISFPLQPSGDV